MFVLLCQVLHMVKPAGSPAHEERRNAIVTHAMNTLDKDHGIYLARKVRACMHVALPDAPATATYMHSCR